MSQDTPRSSLHLHGIRELAPDVDEDIGRLFCEMRRAVGGTAEEIADRLRAEPTTIAALEEGAIRALPEWPETERVVSDYAALLSLDATPILDRLRSQLYPQGPAAPRMEAPAEEAAEAADTDAVMKVPPLVSARDSAADAASGVGSEAEADLALVPDDGDDADLPGHAAPVLTRRRIAIGAAVIGACVLAFIGWSVLSGGSSEPDGRIAGVSDRVTGDSDDPRSRKADKLPVRGQDNSR